MGFGFQRLFKVGGLKLNFHRRGLAAGVAGRAVHLTWRDGGKAAPTGQLTPGVTHTSANAPAAPKPKPQTTKEERIDRAMNVGMKAANVAGLVVGAALAGDADLNDGDGLDDSPTAAMGCMLLVVSVFCGLVALLTAAAEALLGAMVSPWFWVAGLLVLCISGIVAVVKVSCQPIGHHEVDHAHKQWGSYVCPECGAALTFDRGHLGVEVICNVCGCVHKAPASMVVQAGGKAFR